MTGLKNQYNSIANATFSIQVLFVSQNKVHKKETKMLTGLPITMLTPSIVDHFYESSTLSSILSNSWKEKGQDSIN